MNAPNRESFPIAAAFGSHLEWLLTPAATLCLYCPRGRTLNTLCGSFGMPIFMDRHDTLEVTAAEVAEAHRKDLEIQDQYGVRFLTYWFDAARGTIFCLIDAPDKESVQWVHREAHGHVAGEVMEV